jgi:hypothetical protein
VSQPLSRVLEAYEAAWNESRADARQSQLSTCVTDDVVLSPGYKPGTPDLLGVAAVSHEMSEMIASRPPERGLALRLDKGLDHHHDWIRFNWRVADRDGRVFEVGGMRIEGTDIAHVADDGRLDTVIVFVGVHPGGTSTPSG